MAHAELEKVALTRIANETFWPGTLAGSRKSPVARAGVSEQFACCVTGATSSHPTPRARAEGWTVNHEKVQQFVSQRAPRYRPILSRISEAQLNIDPEISDKELDLALHRHFASIESELLAEGHDLMAENPSETIDEYTLKLEAYLFSGPLHLR